MGDPPGFKNVRYSTWHLSLPLILLVLVESGDFPYNPFLTPVSARPCTVLYSNSNTSPSRHAAFVQNVLVATLRTRELGSAGLGLRLRCIASRL